ncbi:Ger(x)C family spore germination protein [Ureibacillus thermosphaericus]|uniref:Ger(x)C family spore germination protein n=1 Tax=Ureibacillus thermosphaericus TaxID=51173 RepID=UPI0030C918F7
MMKRVDFMNYRRKISFILLALMSCSLLLTGCWDQVEVNDLAIVTMAGLDLTDENQLELSVNIARTSSQQPQENSDSSSGQLNGVSVILSTTGNTLAEAVSKLQQKLSRQLFWGHNEIIIFGEKLAKEGIADPLEFLMRHPNTRERANIFISIGSAKEVLSLAPQIDQYVADDLLEMARLQTGLNITLKELMQMMISKSQAAVIPCLIIETKQDHQQSYPFIHGSAILKKGKLAGLVDSSTTRGIMWARNELDRGTVTISPENSEGYISFQLLRSSTEVIPHIHGDLWRITLRIQTLDDIIENTTDLDLSVSKHIEELEMELENDIKRRINEALTVAQEQMNADIFQFADAFYRKYPNIWKQNKDRWSDIFTNLDVVVEADAKISRPGEIGKSILKSNQE